VKRTTGAPPTSATVLINNAAEAIAYAWSAGSNHTCLVDYPDILEFCQQPALPHLDATIRKHALEKVAEIAHDRGADTQYVKHAQQTLMKCLKLLRMDRT
jgi:hypothetical protein